MLTVGITGGIGCGKSFVSRLFECKGVPRYDSDSRTKELYSKRSEVVDKMAALIGSDIVTFADGRRVLDKKRFADKIFGNPSLMDKVKQMLYPVVMSDFRRWRGAQQRLVTIGKSNAPFVLFESAVIAENPIVRRDMDYLIAVEAPIDIRIERVALRDGKSIDEIKAVIAAQESDEFRRASADFVIENVEYESVGEEVERIYDKLRRI